MNTKYHHDMIERYNASDQLLFFSFVDVPINCDERYSMSSPWFSEGMVWSWANQEDLYLVDRDEDQIISKKNI